MHRLDSQNPTGFCDHRDSTIQALLIKIGQGIASGLLLDALCATKPFININPFIRVVPLAISLTTFAAVRFSTNIHCLTFFKKIDQPLYKYSKAAFTVASYATLILFARERGVNPFMFGMAAIAVVGQTYFSHFAKKPDTN